MEGGAGAYSDGKLTTRIGDPLCDNVLEILAAHGAPADIVKRRSRTSARISLKNVVREMRREIIKNGGEVRFRTPLTSVSVKTVRSAPSRQTGRTSPASGRCWPSVTRRATPLPRCTETACTLSRRRSLWACASSTCRPRSTALCTERRRDIPCCRLRSTISRRADGRACYSFCMCPGGVVVAAQSEENTVVTNGMSYHARDGKNANAALAVSVDPKDYDDGTPFGGVALQRRIEHAAYTQTGSYRAPCQKVGDFLNGKADPKTRCGQAQLSHRRGAGRSGSLPARLRADHAAGQPAVFRPEDSRLRHSGRAADRSGNADLVSGAHDARGGTCSDSAAAASFRAAKAPDTRAALCPPPWTEIRAAFRIMGEFAN